MKFFFLIIGAFLIFIPFADALNGSNQAKIIKNEIEELNSSVGDITNCDSIGARIELRFNSLSSVDVVEFFNDYKRTSCLRDDIMELEDDLDEIVNKIPRSSVVCKSSQDDEKLEEYIDEVKILRQKIMCLRVYGENEDETGEDDVKCGEDYNDEKYSQKECKKEKEMFSKVKESFKNLVDTIKALMEDSDEIEGSSPDSLSASSQDNANRQERAKENAEAWVSENLNFSYSGQNLLLGIDWLSSQDEERDTIIDNSKKEQEPKRDKVSLNGVSHIIYAEIEAEQAEYEFAKALGEFYVDNEMYPAINARIAYDLEKIMHCVQYSYERTASSSGDTKPKCGENQEDCGCEDVIIEDTEGLREKTKELKKLLDSHNQ